MLKFRGFKASLNFAYTKKNKDDIENYPTGPHNISLAGAYRANREEFFGYGSLSEPPKKITPAMVKLPPSRIQPPSTSNQQEQPKPDIQPSKSTSDLLASPLTNPPPMLRKSTTDISTDPRGRTVSENRDSTDFHTKKDVARPQSKEQKLLERQQKKQKKIAEEKEAKLKKEREKAEKDREKAEREKEKKQAKAKKPEREKKSKSKAPPLPKTPPPTTIDDPIVILDQLPTGESQPFLTVNQPDTTNHPQVISQLPKTTNQPPQIITQLPKPNPPTQVIQEPPTINEQPKTANQQPKATRQPKAAQRTNPVAPPLQNYSTNTLDSNISRNSGPPPYEEVMPNTNDKAGNTSFGKRIEESNNSWDLVSQHREQMRSKPVPMAKERRPKRMVMDLKFDSGFGQTMENSDA